jgi:hypothetical protein
MEVVVVEPWKDFAAGGIEDGIAAVPVCAGADRDNAASLDAEIGQSRTDPGSAHHQGRQRDPPRDRAGPPDRIWSPDRI